MAGKIGDSGYLCIEKLEDRAVVAEILYRNGYTVSPVRTKLNGKSYTYMLKYEIRPLDMEDE